MRIYFIIATITVVTSRKSDEEKAPYITGSGNEKDASVTSTPDSSISSTPDSAFPSSEGGESYQPAHECNSDEDCPDSSCIEIINGGFRACKQSIPEAERDCTNGNDDDCCHSADCSQGKCYTIREVPAYRYLPPSDYHYRYIDKTMCLSDLCEDDGDCSGNQVCVAAFTVGVPNKRCFPALCNTDEDCNEFPGGICAPVEDECGAFGIALWCIYPEFGCRRNSDCSSDEPPFTEGETLCQFGECMTVISGAWCE